MILRRCAAATVFVRSVSSFYCVSQSFMSSSYLKFVGVVQAAVVVAVPVGEAVAEGVADAEEGGGSRRSNSNSSSSRRRRRSSSSSSSSSSSNILK